MSREGRVRMSRESAARPTNAGHYYDDTQASHRPDSKLALNVKLLGRSMKGAWARNREGRRITPSLRLPNGCATLRLMISERRATAIVSCNSGYQPGGRKKDDPMDPPFPGRGFKVILMWQDGRNEGSSADTALTRS